MINRKEPIMNEDYYANNLDAEQEAFLRRKKNNDLKNALKNGFGTGKLRVEPVDMESKPISDGYIPEVFGTMSESMPDFIQNKDISTNENNSSIHKYKNTRTDISENEILDNRYEQEQKINENHGDIENLTRANVVEDLSEAVEDLSEAVEDFEIKEEVFIKRFNYSEEEYRATDLVEMSKIYYYAEMLDRFIGQEAAKYEMLEDEPFIDIIRKELEKLLKKEQHSDLYLLYTTSSQGTRFSSLMDIMHRNNVFMGYIDNQSEIFSKERPLRVSSLNWSLLYKRNYENKVWLQPVEYANNSNESITPWTRSGLLIWFLGFIFASIGAYFYGQKEGSTIMQVLSPFIVVICLLSIASLLDFLGSLYVRLKYKKLEQAFLDIKNTVNETIVNKKDLNPLMFDVCIYYIKKFKK